MKKRVCILSHGLESGGIGTFVANVIQGLDLNKYEATLILALDQEGSYQFRENEVLARGVQILRTNDLDGIKKKALHFIRLYHILKENKFEVIHANMDMLNGLNLFVAFLARVPVRICHSHTIGSTYETQIGKRSRIICIYRWLMRKMCWRFSTHRCGCSKAAMDYLYGEKWKDDPYSKIIYNGIDLGAFKRTETDRKSKDFYQIVTVGRITEVKNPFFTVKVLKALSVLSKDFKSIWVGTGHLADSVTAWIQNEGLRKSVSMMGARHDVPQILRNCDLFLLPSLFEGLGIVLVEAQAAGLPCIASDKVPEDVNCGLVEFFPLEKSPKYWAQEISNYMDGKKTMKIDSKRLSRFDLNNMILQLEQIYG